MKTLIRKIVISSMVAALIFVATMIIKIPSPLSGYINLGDSIVLLAAWTLPPAYSFLAAGVGSALADVLSPYIEYAPVTFLIKGLMAIIAYGSYTLLSKKSKNLISKIISGVLAEIVMIFGYYLFEGILYGFVPSLVNIPANAIQGIAGIIFGTALLTVFEKQDLIKILKL